MQQTGAPVLTPLLALPEDVGTVVMETAPLRAENVETVAMATPSGWSSEAFESGPVGQTMPGSLVGTPAYMSPEQALGKEIDFRSDV